MKIFFGAGRIGKYAYDLCRIFGVMPDYFADNSEEMAGKIYCGIKVLHFCEVYAQEKADILITCKNVDEITRQLTAMGVPDRHIWIGTDNLSILEYLCHIPREELEFHKNDRRASTQKKQVFFDLSNGLVLGGVETWTFKMAAQLQRKGYNTAFITKSAAELEIKPEGIKVIELHNLTLEKDKIQKCMDTIYAHLPCTIICNFPQWIFAAACMAKKLSPEDIHTVAVVHNDEDLYYNAYTKLKDYIDLCLVISSRTCKKLVERGFPEEKIKLLQWDVPMKKQLKRGYSDPGEPVRIGYAGRLVTTAKRVDLLIRVAERLDQKGCDYILEIAGSGSYEENMRQQIQSLNLQHRIILSGFLKRNLIPQFWERQDIMISCSEREGHSISQVEAMASGAVPVITDTSGARDDVDDGYNGYVVEVGQIEELVNKIMYLSKHREKLAQMGKNAYETIKMRSEQPDLIEQFMETQMR